MKTSSTRSVALYRQAVVLQELFTLLRYMASSLITAAVDYLVFLTIYPLIQNIALSIFLARAASVLVNYLLLRLAVFRNREHILHTFPRYILLVVVSGAIASFMIPQWMRWLNIPIIIAKMLTEAILYFINYIILKYLVFLRKI